MKLPWSRRKGNEAVAAPGRADPEPDGGVGANAAMFAAYARDTGGWVLDHSERSVDVMEGMLALLSRRAGSMSPGEKALIIDCGGCYLLDVARRRFGGVIKRYDPRGLPLLVVGEPAFSAAFLAHDKVEGRLSGDEGDNLPFHFDGLRDAVAAKRSVLYV